MDTTDVDEQATAASSRQDSQTERTSSVGKREQAISSEPDAQQHQWTRRMWTNKQQQQATAASSRQDRRRGHPALASESKRSVESWAGIGTNGHDGCERTIAASNRTDREDSGRKREQTVVSRAAGVDELQQQATGQPDGEDSGRKREQAITREPSGGCERTSNSSKQPTGQLDEEDIQHSQARASDQ